MLKSGLLHIEGFSALSNRPPLEPRSDCSAVAVAKSAKPYNLQKKNVVTNLDLLPATSANIPIVLGYRVDSDLYA